MVTKASPNPSLVEHLPTGLAQLKGPWASASIRINSLGVQPFIDNAANVVVTITDAVVAQAVIISSQETGEIASQETGEIAPLWLLLERQEASTVSSPTTPTQASTGPRTDYSADEKAFVHLLASLRDKWDNDDTTGMEAVLTTFLSRSGGAGIVALAVAAEHERIGPLLLVDVMALLARSQEPDHYNASRWMMRKLLSQSSAAVRYGALCGLLSLEDRGAIPMLQKAIAVEHLSELRRELVRGIEYLRSL